MKILFIGNVMSEELQEILIKNKIHNISIASQKYQLNFLKGLEKNFNVNDLSILSIIPSKKYNSNVLKTKIKNHSSIYVKSQNILNLCIYLYKYIHKWSEKKDQEYVIIEYATNPLVFLVVKYLSKKQKNILYFNICSEIPKYRRYKKNLKSLVKKTILTFCVNRYDYYILLSKHMIEKIKCANNDNSIVIEAITGILTGTSMNINDKKNVIMYAGGLAKDNNVPAIVEAGIKSRLCDEVWVFGDGEDRKKIENYKLNNKVRYYGVCSNDYVRKKEYQAKVLINFRNNDVLSKYSFPSKILEYLSVGVPIISTNLEGIPDEYFKYLFVVEEKNIDQLVIIIDNILSKNEKNLNDIQKKYITFANEKNYINQGKKIINFINKKVG